MSINDHTSAEGSSSDRAIAVHRTPLAESQDAAWPAAAAWAEPAPPSGLNLSLYLHGLRRHWLAATAIGLLCAAVAAAIVWLAVGPKYRYSAWVRVFTVEDSIVDQGGRPITQRVYELFKATQAQLIQNDIVLTPALRDNREVQDATGQEAAYQIAWLKRELEVSSDDSEFITVSITDRDAQNAKTLVDAVVSAYMTEVVEKDRTRKNKRLAKLEAAHRKVAQEAETNRNELQRLATNLGTSDKETLSVAERNALEQYAQYRREQTRLEFAWRQATEELAAQKTLLGEVETLEISEYEVEAAAANNWTLRRLKEQMLAQQWDADYNKEKATSDGRSRHAQTLGEDFGRTQAQLEKEIAALRRQIQGVRKAEIEKLIRDLVVQVTVNDKLLQEVKGDLKAQEDRVSEIGKTSIEIEMKRIDIENLDRMLVTIAGQRDTLQVELDADPRIQALDYAPKPETAENTPIRVTLTVLAVLAGLCLPMAGIVWWDTRAKRINNSAEVSANLGLTVLGSVPMIPAQVIRRLGSPSRRNQGWQLRLTESIDGITARLLRKAAINETRVILVTSAVSAEGKTTLATQLAMSLARSGRNTLLLDFDLRRPAFDRVFGLPLEPGVSEVLRGETAVEGLVHPTGDNLSVMTAGRWDRHALAALANGAAGSMFKELAAEHDFVVVDASPVLPVADTRFVSQYVDTVVLSVFRDVSQAPKVDAAREILEAFGVESVEAVVTGSTEGLRDKDMGYQPRMSA